ncbi:MAG: hypothetical protein AAFO96_03785 [Bacteroidota bacterium]
MSLHHISGEEYESSYINFNEWSGYSLGDFMLLDQDTQFLAVNELGFNHYPYPKPDWFSLLQKTVNRDFTQEEATRIPEIAHQFGMSYRIALTRTMSSSLATELSNNPVPFELLNTKVAIDLHLNRDIMVFVIGKFMTYVAELRYHYRSLAHPMFEPPSSESYFEFSMPVPLQNGDFVKLLVGFQFYFCRSHLLPHTQVENIEWQMDSFYSNNWMIELKSQRQGSINYNHILHQHLNLN